jgi:hypothetical protein
MDQKANGHKMLSNLRESATETLPMIRQVFREESMSRAGKAQTHLERKQARQAKGKFKSMLISFLDIKGCS